MHARPASGFIVKQEVSVFGQNLPFGATLILLSRKLEQVLTAGQAFKTNCKFHSYFP